MDAASSPSAPDRKSAPPLLPAVLLGPPALLWLWVLPIGILLLLNLQGYWLIEGNMDASQLSTAHHLGFAGLLNLLTGLALWAFTTWLLRQPVSALTRHFV